MRSPLDLQPGSPFRPLVVGPEAVPWIRDPEEARRDPELAALAARCHGNEPGGAANDAALRQAPPRQ